MNKKILHITIGLIMILLTIQGALATTYSYWKEDGATDTVWTKVNLTGGSSLIVTVTDAAGTYAQDCAATFVFCDDFNSNASLSGWTINSPLTAYKDNGSLRVQRLTSSNIAVYKGYTHTGNLTYMTRALSPSTTSNKYANFYGDSANQRMVWSFAGANIQGGSGFSNMWAGNYTASNWEKIEIDYDTTANADYFVNVNPYGPYTHFSHATTKRVEFMSGEISTVNAFYDFVNLREYTATPPSIVCVANTCNITSTDTLTDYQVALTTTGLTGNLKVADAETAASIIITPLLPTANDHLNDDPVVYRFNVTATNTVNCSLYVNDTLQTTETNFAGTLLNMSDSQIDGSWDWYANCTDADGITNVSTTRTVVIDSVAPDWTIRSLETDNTTIFAVGSTYTFNDSVDDTYLFGWNITITNSTDNIRYTNQTTNLSSTTETIIDSVDMTGWNSGYYTVTFTAEDDHTARTIPNYDVSTTQNGAVYTTPTNTIRIETETGNLKGFTTQKTNDRYSFSFEQNTAQTEWSINLFCDDTIYDRGTLYPYPTFVCGKNWVDFKTTTPGLQRTEVKKVASGAYNVKFIFDQAQKKVDFNSLGGLNIRTESYEFGLDVNPPPAPQNMTNTNTTKTSLAIAWDDTEDTNWNHTEVYIDAAWIANVTSGTYEATGLTPNTNYTFSLYSVSHAGYKNNTALTNTYQTSPNTAPTINDYTPTTLTTAAENTTQGFTVNATDDDGAPTITWQLDGTNQTTGDNWNWSIPKTAQGTHNVTVIATDLYGATTTHTWIFTVTDDYIAPSTPVTLKPLRGTYDRGTVVICDNNQERSTDDPFYYHVQYKTNNGSWTTLYNNTIGIGPLNLATHAYGDEIDLQCKITNTIGNTTWYNPTGTLTKKQAFEFDLVDLDQPYKAANKPYQLAIRANTNGTNERIQKIGIDCDDNNIIDYAWEYNNTISAYNIAWCIQRTGYHAVNAYLYVTTNTTHDITPCANMEGTTCLIRKSYTYAFI